MRLDPILSKAVRLARKKNYNDAIKTLENEASRYYGSFNYYYILGLSYLYSKIFGRSLSYLKLAYKQKMRDPNTLLALAALYLNHGDTDKAVDLYLEVQSIEESHKTVQKALKIIRKYPGPENISSWIDSGRFHQLFPPFPRVDISKKKLILTILAAAAGLCVILGITFKVLFPSWNKSQRPVSAELNLSPEERNSPVETGGSYRYVLTRNQVLDDYNDALKLFADYRDDAARVRLNRILESNASDPIKNRARLLASFMEAPGFNTLKDRFSYSEVTGDPFLYRDCHVIWKGMVSNLSTEQNRTSFDFLVGYDTRRTMEGIVQVDYNFAIPVNPEYPVEILGRVIPVSSERELGIRIQGIALNQAGLLEQM
jgi:tetratricopeptide (TPR) repeat protein